MSTAIGRRVRTATDAPDLRTYGVCVGGACVQIEDEDLRDPVDALRRAEELKADPDNAGEPVTVVLW